MKTKKSNDVNLENLELECGNCWGHQQYEQGYRPKKIDYWKGRRLNFISRFLRIG